MPHHDGDLTTAPWAEAAKISEKQLFCGAIDAGKLIRYSKALEEAGVWVCPTISAFFQMKSPKDRVARAMEYLPPRYLARLVQNHVPADYPEAAVESAE